MGKEGKYDLKLAEPPAPPESDSDSESSPNDGLKTERIVKREDHPTSYLKNASVTLLRVILLSFGMEAERVQPTAVRILSSVLRGIISTAIKADSSLQTQLGKFNKVINDCSKLKK